MSLCQCERGSKKIRQSQIGSSSAYWTPPGRPTPGLWGCTVPGGTIEHPCSWNPMWVKSLGVLQSCNLASEISLLTYEMGMIRTVMPCRHVARAKWINARTVNATQGSQSRSDGSCYMLVTVVRRRWVWACSGTKIAAEVWFQFFIAHYPLHWETSKIKARDDAALRVTASWYLLNEGRRGSGRIFGNLRSKRGRELS